ncbi:MAG: AsmA family protein [Alphaproteobacteria bacterium]|nr:AsmA family protein [Alphaproteobacteria bacterium]
MSAKRRGNILAAMRVVGLFFVGMVVAVVVALNQLNLEKLRGNVLGILRDATGVPVEIDGNVSWKLSLRPIIELNKIRVPNAEWAKCKNAFSAEKIDVRINLLSLFQSRPTIQKIKIYDASVCIEKNSDGLYSVQTHTTNSDDEETLSVKSQSKYPFSDSGLGGIEFKNLTAKIFDETYSLSGFNIHYISRRDKREYVGWIKPDKDVFPFIISFSEYNVERRIYPMRVAVSTGGDALIANVALEGTSRAPIDFIIKGDITDVESLGRVFNLDWSYMPRLKVNIAGGFDWKKLTFRKSSIAIHGVPISFSGDVDWSGNRPVINADVDAGRVELVKMFPNIYGRVWVRPKRELNVFHDIPLFGHELAMMDMKLRINVDDFIMYRDLDLRDVDLDLRFNNGAGRIDGTVGFASGDIKIGGDINIDNDGVFNIKAAVRGRGITIGNLLEQIRENNLISGLPVSLDAYLEGYGANLSQLMETITGPVVAYAESGGYAHSDLVSYIYGTDFLTSLRHSIQDLFSSEKKHNQIKISCLTLNTKLRNGVAETSNGVALESNAINVWLVGNLNLGGEKIHLALTTVPSRGIKLSLTGNVVNSIEIRGNLAEPDINISGAAITGKVVSATVLGGVVATLTGGLGVLAGAGVGLLAGDLLSNWLADDQPCKTAMKKGAPVFKGDPVWLDMPITELQNGIFDSAHKIKNYR